MIILVENYRLAVFLCIVYHRIILFLSFPTRCVVAFDSTLIKVVGSININ